MTWTGITKERTCVQQTGHHVPNFPFRVKDEELVLQDSCPGRDTVALLDRQVTAAWDWAGCANWLAVKTPESSRGKKSCFVNWRQDIRHSILFKKIVYSFTVQSKQEENENWRDKSRQLSLPKLWTVITGITELKPCSLCATTTFTKVGLISAPRDQLQGLWSCSVTEDGKCIKHEHLALRACSEESQSCVCTAP